MPGTTEPPAFAVIFDLDGTLVDSEPLHLASTNAVLGRYGAHLTARDNSVYLGMDDASYWTALRSRFEIPTAVSELTRHRLESLADLLPRVEVPLASGIGAFMSSLAAADVPMAVASSSPIAVVRRLIEIGGLASFIRATAGGDEVPQAKPDPAVYQLAAARLGVKDTPVLCFEDSARGIEAARVAGFAVVGMRTPGNDGQDLSGASMEIVDFREMTLDRARAAAGVPAGRVPARGGVN